MTFDVDFDPGISLYVGGLSEKVTEDLLWELFVQAGPVTSVKIILDNVTKTPKGFAFVQFKHAMSGDYAIKLFNETALFGRNIVVRNSNRGGGASSAPSTPAPPNPYLAAQQQLHVLQQQALMQSTAAREAILNSGQSPSAMGTYAPRGGITYRSPHDQTPAAASPYPRSTDYHRTPGYGQSSRGRSPERPSPGARHSDYNQPASDRRYSSEEPERKYSRDSRDGGRSDSTDSGRDRVYHRYDSQPPYSKGYSDRREPERSHGYSDRQYSSGGGGSSNATPPAVNRPGYAGQAALAPSSSQRSYDFTPDRPAHAASRYHPYGRPPSQHGSAAPPSPADQGQFRQYHNRY